MTPIQTVERPVGAASTAWAPWPQRSWPLDRVLFMGTYGVRLGTLLRFARCPGVPHTATRHASLLRAYLCSGFKTINDPLMSPSRRASGHITAPPRMCPRLTFFLYCPPVPRAQTHWAFRHFSKGDLCFRTFACSLRQKTHPRCLLRGHALGQAPWGGM